MLSNRLRGKRDRRRSGTRQTRSFIAWHRETDKTFQRDIFCGLTIEVTYVRVKVGLPGGPDLSTGVLENKSH